MRWAGCAVGHRDRVLFREGYDKSLAAAVIGRPGDEITAGITTAVGLVAAGPGLRAVRSLFDKQT